MHTTPLGLGNKGKEVLKNTLRTNFLGEKESMDSIEDALQAFQVLLKDRERIGSEIEEYIKFFIAARHKLRIEQNWQLADAIRNGLIGEEVYFEDFPKVTQVRRGKYKYLYREYLTP